MTPQAPRETPPAAPPPAPAQQSEEQLRYARWLEHGTRAGLLLLALGFAAYALGLLPAAMPPERLVQHWQLPVAEFLRAGGGVSGWAWLRDLGRGDLFSLGTLALLASVSVPALLALLPSAFARGERALAWLCLAQVAVIALAASGLLNRWS